MNWVKVNLHDGGVGRSSLSGFNNVGGPTTTGVRVADLLDETDTATGHTLTVNGAFTGATGGTSLAVSSPDALFPVEFFQCAWYAGSSDQSAATITIGGLPVGETVELKVSGNSGSTARDTNFSLTGGSPDPALYDVAGTEPVTQPPTITATVPPGGELTLSNSLVSTFLYNNGFAYRIVTAASPTITDVDTDNAVDQYQLVNFNGVSGFGGPITSGTLGGTAITIVDGDWQTNAGVVSARIPGSLATGTYDAVLSDGTSTATLTGVSYTQTHPRPAYYGLVDSNSILNGQSYTSGTYFKFTTAFTHGTLDLAAGDAAGWAGDIRDYYTADAGWTGNDVATVQFLYSDGTTSATFDTTVFTPNLPKDVVVFGSPTIGSTTASVPFTYAGTDATGFEYSLDGTTWTTTGTPVQLSLLTADTSYDLQVRPFNGDGSGTAVTYTLTTAPAIDAAPDAFSFTAQTNVARSITVTSNAIAVTGVSAGTDIPVTVAGDTGSEYSVSTDGGSTYGGWTAAQTNVRLNYRVRVRHTTSSEYSSGGYNGVRQTTLTVGGVSSTFTSTTLADTVKPTISLVGGNISLAQGNAFFEPGYTATDNADGDITVSGVVVTGSVDTSTVGTYTLTYTATDASGNQSSTTRTVTVTEFVPQDTTKPTIALTGGNQVLTVGDTWVDPGFTATDETDGNLTGSVTITGAVNASVAGTYTLTYSVTDAAGNIGTATRTVTVEPAIQYPMDVVAPAKRTFVANRLLQFKSSEPLFFLQSGEILDYDFDLSDWIAEQGGSLAQGSHEVTEIAEALTVLASNPITGTSRVKVWLEAGKVTDSQSSLVQLKISTTGKRTAVFSFRVVIINRMQ